MKSKKIVLTTLSPKSHRTSEENLGIGYLKSSLASEDFEVIIIDGWLNNYSVQEVYDRIKINNELLFVGISSYMTNTKPTVELISMLKKDNYTVVCGGFGPTFYTDEYLKNGADYVIRGEGEKAILGLAMSLYHVNDSLNVKGLSYINKDGEVVHNDLSVLEDLDSYLFPSRDTMHLVLNRKSTVNMVTSRGCSGNCEFCSVIAFFRKCSGNKWRTRSIKNIVDEVELLYKDGVNHIKMVDDSFVDGTRDANWCREFAQEIMKRNINVKFRGQIRADKVNDEILLYLKQAGFYSFACGIENGSSSALKRMNKSATLEDNEKALKLFKKYGYIVQMGFILFDKETTMKELWENYNFLNKYIFAVTKGIFSEMYSAEGTKLNEKLKSSQNFKSSDFIDSNNRYTLDNVIVSEAYKLLKIWHKSHSYIYDMTIDPLSAPKTITDDSRDKLLSLALKLKEMDLAVFKKILESIDEQKTIDIDLEIKQTQSFYEKHYELLKEIYIKEQLIYDADINPFI